MIQIKYYHTVGEKVPFIYLMYTYEWYYVPGSLLNPECILAMLCLHVT